MEENWDEWRNELKAGLDRVTEKIGNLISHAEKLGLPPYLEPITLSSTKQTLKRRGYTFAYLLVSQETLASLGSSLINLQMGTMTVQMQAGQGLVQIPLVSEECRYWVDGLSGSWDAVVYFTMQEAPAVTPLGSSSTSPLITELTGQLVPRAVKVINIVGELNVTEVSGETFSSTGPLVSIAPSYSPPPKNDFFIIDITRFPIHTAPKGNPTTNPIPAPREIQSIVDMRSLPLCLSNDR